MKNKISKVLVFALLCLTFSVNAGEVAGYYRSNGTYVRPHYRSSGSSFGSSSRSVNPNASPYRVQVRSYRKDNGTLVSGHQRTRANKTLKSDIHLRIPLKRPPANLPVPASDRIWICGATPAVAVTAVASALVDSGRCRCGACRQDGGRHCHL